MNASEVVEKAVIEINEFLDAENQIIYAESTALLSEGTTIDSLTLVNLLLTIERIVLEDENKAISVITDDALQAGASPFKTIGSLVRHLDKVLAS